VSNISRAAAQWRNKGLSLPVASLRET